MRYEMILEKVKKLAGIYADDKMGPDSNDAKSLIKSLLQEKDSEVQKAILSATNKATSKKLRDEIFPAIKKDMDNLRSTGENKSDKPQVTVNKDNSAELDSKQIEELSEFALLASEMGINLRRINKNNFDATIETLKNEANKRQTSNSLQADTEENDATEAFKESIKDYPDQDTLAALFAEANENEDELKKNNPPADNGLKPLDVGVLGNDSPQNDNDNTNTNEDDKSWVEQKIASYQKMKSNNTIHDFEVTQQDENGFEAELEGGKIRYTARDNVLISPDSQIKVFEAVLQEKDNIGRPINFGENMPLEMAIRLAAACVLHGNKMQGNVPDLAGLMNSPEGLQALKNELGDRFAEFENKFNANTNTGENKNESNPISAQQNDEKADNKPANLEVLQNATARIKAIREDIEKMKEDGTIVFEYKDNKYEIIAGENGTAEDVKLANDKMNEAADLTLKIRKSAIDVKAENAEELKAARGEFNQEHIKHLRTMLSTDKLQEHDALKGSVGADGKYHTSDARKQRREQIAKTYGGLNNGNQRTI